MSDDPKTEIRAASAAPATEGRRISGHFARFGSFNEIDSVVEGRFLERIEPGAFKKTLAEQGAKIRMLFQHGRDPQIGDKPIGSPDVLREDRIGPYFEADLFDSVPPLIVDGLRAGQYGISYRFSVMDEEWNHEPTRSDYNPDALPERTIKQARVFEFGPVTFPADPRADYAVRSLTLTDLDAPYQAPEDPAPVEVAAAEPHDEVGREVTSTPQPSPVVETTQVSDEYRTRDEMVARAADLRATIQSVNDQYPGTMPDDVQAQWDKDVAELARLDAGIAAKDARNATVAKMVASDGPQVERPNVIVRTTVEDIYDLNAIRNSTRSADEYAGKVRDHALRSIDGARVARTADLNALANIVDYADEGTEGRSEVAERILLTGSPAYRRAFSKYLRGQSALWTQEENRAAALAVTGTTTTGGYAVPYVFDPTMVHIGVHTTVNPYRSHCRVETITNGNNWKAVTVGAITAAYGTEALALTEGGPTFGQPDYTVQTARAFVTLSHETLQDRPDAVSELTSLFGEAKDTLEENQFTLGTGATVYPFGMFRTAAYTNQDTATNDTTAITDMRLLESVLPIRHRANASFWMSRSTLRQLMAMDTTFQYFSGAGINYAGQGNPAESGAGNTGIRLLGYPVVEVPSAVSTLTTDGAIFCVFGDPRSYVIVDRIGMNVEVIQNMLDGATPSFPTMQRGVLAYWRNTARPINADAMRSMSVQ